jgi:hypothetical protein
VVTGADARARLEAGKKFKRIVLELAAQVFFFLVHQLGWLVD